MKRISRRTVLRGLGTAIALPWLEAMTPQRGIAAGLSGDRKALAPLEVEPIRVAFFYVPNGMHMPDWKPQGPDGQEFELGPTLKPVESFREKLNVFSGLALRNAESLGSGPGDHARSNAAFLTGAHPKKTNGNNLRNGISIDQLAAQKLGDLTRLKSLELGLESSAVAGDCDSGYSCAYSSNLSWRNETSPLPKEINPRVVFERLFGSEDEQTRKESLALRERRRKSILDFANAEAKALSQRLGSQDRLKLDEYLYAVRELERRLQNTERLEQPEIDLSNFQRPKGVPRQYEEHAKLLMEMLILAFQTDSTRIATFSFANEGSNRAYRNLSINEGHHEISHHGGAAEKHEKIAKINLFHMELFSGFLAQLNSIREGERTLLDNSLILYGSGISDGNAHSHHDLPIALFGSAGGQIKTGRHLRCRDRTPLTNLYCSMLKLLKVPVEEFSDSTGLIEEL
jgi:hypothetical protein